MRGSPSDVEITFEALDGNDTNSIVSQVLYKKIMADVWSEQMSTEMVSLVGSQVE